MLISSLTMYVRVPRSKLLAHTHIYTLNNAGLFEPKFASNLLHSLVVWQ